MQISRRIFKNLWRYLSAMTEEQKAQARRLRAEGFGYSRIAAILGVPDNTVKSYCRRQGLTGSMGFEQRDAAQEHFYLQCGLPVRQNPGRKEKK